MPYTCNTCKARGFCNELCDDVRGELPRIDTRSARAPDGRTGELCAREQGGECCIATGPGMSRQEEIRTRAQHVNIMLEAAAGKWWDIAGPVRLTDAQRETVQVLYCGYTVTRDGRSIAVDYEDIGDHAVAARVLGIQQPALRRRLQGVRKLLGIPASGRGSRRLPANRRPLQTHGQAPHLPRIPQAPHWAQDRDARIHNTDLWMATWESLTDGAARDELATMATSRGQTPSRG